MSQQSPKRCIELIWRWSDYHKGVLSAMARIVPGGAEKCDAIGTTDHVIEQRHFEERDYGALT